jgi:hypothetical protein
MMTLTHIPIAIPTDTPTDTPTITLTPSKTPIPVWRTITGKSGKHLEREKAKGKREKGSRLPPL